MVACRARCAGSGRRSRTSSTRFRSVARARPSSRSTTSRSSATQRRCRASTARLSARGAARRSARCARDRRLRADEARRRRALRRAAGEDRRHAARRRCRVLAGAGRGAARLSPASSARSRQRKDPLAAADAAHAVGLPLVVAGPSREPRAGARARAPRRGSSRLRDKAELAEPLSRRRLPRAAVPVRGLRPAGARGDGVRARRSSPPQDPALREVAGTPPSTRARGSSPRPCGEALAERESSSAPRASSGRRPSAGRRRRDGRSTSTARCSGCEGLGDRRLARPCATSSRARCRRSCPRWTRCS